jgi:hypothetical protein
MQRNRQAMTLQTMQEIAWQSLPPIRKRMVGRATVNDLVVCAIHNWEGEYLAACADNNQRQVYARGLLQAVKRAHQPISGYEAQEYGFIWVFLLQAVATALIQWLVEWWLKSHANRVLIEGWKRELAS